MNKKRIIIAIAIIDILLITLLSTLNLSVTVEPQGIGHLDKVVHFCFYFSMNLLLMAATMVCCRPTGSRWMLLTTLAAITYGAGIEVVQIYVGRDFDLLDILANSAGAFTALFIAQNGVINSYIRRFLSIS